MDYTQIHTHNGQERMKFCRDCCTITPYIRKTYYIGRLIYAADECQSCGDRSNISKVDPATLKDISDGR